MAKLTYGVEVELQHNMDNLELRLQKVANVAQNLEPEFERLQAKLAAIEDFVNSRLDISVRRSDDSINNGIKFADQLQQILAAMIQTALDGDSRLANAQERSVALLEEREADLRDWTAVLTTATASVQTLNSQIVCVVVDSIVDLDASIHNNVLKSETNLQSCSNYPTSRWRHILGNSAHLQRISNDWLQLPTTYPQSMKIMLTRLSK